MSSLSFAHTSAWKGDTCVALCDLEQKHELNLLVRSACELAEQIGH
jgi:hypothetical protein